MNAVQRMKKNHGFLGNCSAAIEPSKCIDVWKNNALITFQDETDLSSTNAFPKFTVGSMNYEPTNFAVYDSNFPFQ